MSITVYTTTQHTYVLANGTGVTLDGIAPTGELAVTVTGADPDAEPLGRFGSVEAVYQSGEAVMTASGTPAKPGTFG